MSEQDEVNLRGRIKELEAEVAHLQLENAKWNTANSKACEALLAENLRLSERLGRCSEALEKITDYSDETSSCAVAKDCLTSLSKG